MVAHIDDVASVRIVLCRICGGFVEGGASDKRPNQLAFQKWTMSLFLPTHRSIEPYYGGCECPPSTLEHPRLRIEFYEEGDGG